MSFHQEPFFKNYNPRIYRYPRGGNGRYLYRSSSAAETVIRVIDLSLVTAGNYVGAGVWTTDPQSQITGLNSLGATSLAYNPDRMEIYRGRSGTGAFEIIDANPSSGTFNTRIATGTNSLGSHGFCVYHQPTRLILIHSNSTIYFFNSATNTVIKSFSVTETVSFIQVSPFNGDIILLFVNGYKIIRVTGFRNGAPILKGIDGGKIDFQLLGFLKNRPDLVYGDSISTNNVISVFKYPNLFDASFDNFEILSSVSQSHSSATTNGSYPVNNKTNRGFACNGLVTYTYDLSNPLAISSVTSHTRTAVGTESITTAMLVSEEYGVLALFANNTGNCVHFYDISAGSLTYIGYVNYTTANQGQKGIALNKVNNL